MDGKNILFYPHFPVRRAAICKILKKLNMGMARNKRIKHNLGIYWKDRTYTKFRWPESTNMLIINRNCNDISKKHVDLVHKNIFGYSTKVNPKTYRGAYVQKLNLNGMHMAFLRKRRSSPLPGFFYQILVDNSDGNMVIDHRVPVFGHTAPFTYKIYRSIKRRFMILNNTIEIHPFEKTFSQKERELIFRFCDEIGLDYGELDILRDNKSKRIYIIDVNKTPWGPPLGLPEYQKEEAVLKMADSFKKAFLEKV